MDEAPLTLDDIVAARGSTELDTIIELYNKILQDDSSPPFNQALTYPLITFSEDINGRTPIDVRISSMDAAALAYRWGIPKEASTAYAINLASEKDRKWLASGKWLDHWNGVWIIREYIEDGFACVDTGKNDIYLVRAKLSANKFLEKFGGAIIESGNLKRVFVLAKDSPVISNPEKSFGLYLMQGISKAMLARPVVVISHYDVEVIRNGENIGVAKASAGATLVTPEVAVQLTNGTKTSGAWNRLQISERDHKKLVRRQARRAEKAAQEAQAEQNPD